MAYDPEPRHWFNYPTAGGDVGAGHFTLQEIGPELRFVANAVADIFMATGFVKEYRSVYNTGFQHITKAKIRRWTKSFLTEKDIHMPSLEGTWPTAFEAAINVALSGWGMSEEVAREFFKAEGAFDLNVIGASVDMGDMEPIRAACKRIGQGLVEQLTIDGWMDDGSPDLPWLPTKFTNEDGSKTEMVRGDDWIDPEMYESGYRYTWAMVNRVGLIFWLWINQRMISYIIQKMNLVDSSRSHVLGTGG